MYPTEDLFRLSTVNSNSIIGVIRFIMVYIYSDIINYEQL